MSLFILPFKPIFFIITLWLKCLINKIIFTWELVVQLNNLHGKKDTEQCFTSNYLK